MATGSVSLEQAWPAGKVTCRSACLSWLAAYRSRCPALKTKPMPSHSREAQETTKPFNKDPPAARTRTQQRGKGGIGQYAEQHFLGSNPALERRAW